MFFFFFRKSPVEGGGGGGGGGGPGREGVGCRLLGKEVLPFLNWTGTCHRAKTTSFSKM